VGALEIENALE